MKLYTDAEITPTEIRKGETDVSGNDTFEIRQFDGKAHYNEIKSRIQHLESELSSVLHSLRTRVDEAVMQTADEAAMQTVSIYNQFLRGLPCKLERIIIRYKKKRKEKILGE